MGEIIKATAKYQDAELNKQKPIIQIDGVDGETLRENLIRASIDSGRDNPFRPDGEIYKSADPIVDYYKYGPNQSRTQSPTDSQLLIGQDGSSKKRKKTKKDKRHSNKTNKDNEDHTNQKKACWRRWLCCCCCGCCAKKRTDEGSEAHRANKLDLSNGQPKSMTNEDSKRDKEVKQPKIVVLNTPETSPTISGATTATTTTTTSTTTKVTSHTSTNNEARDEIKSSTSTTDIKTTNGNVEQTTTTVSSENKPIEVHTTKVKSKSSKCVIS